MILGHQKQWSFLQKMAASGRIPQALLFSGQEYLGKKKVALEFVKLLNCQGDGGEPCGKCFSCSAFEKGNHPDLLSVAPSPKEIQIGQVRDAQRFLSYTRQMAKFKAVIIDEAHCLNQEAQNCLLKTLEEPQPYTVLILVTSLPQVLFKTILSRCEELKFYPVDGAEMARCFVGHKNNPQWQEILNWSDGRPDLALQFFQDKDLVKKRISNFQLIENLLNSDLAQRLLLVKDYWAETAGQNKDASEDETDNSFASLRDFLENWLFYVRRLLHQKIAGGGSSSDSAMQLVCLLRKIDDLKFLLLNTNINKRLLLENLVLNL